jgi:hypothetical protein
VGEIGGEEQRLVADPLDRVAEGSLAPFAAEIDLSRLHVLAGLFLDSLGLFIFCL